MKPFVRHRVPRATSVRQPSTVAIALGLVAWLAAGACTTDASPIATGDTASAHASSPIGSAQASVSPGDETTTAIPDRIPQPPLGEWRRITGDQLASLDDRVDLLMPTFSDPTSVTNPLFPIGSLHSAVSLGHVDGERLRVETTLLSETKIVEWNGLQIETLQSQFLAYHDGRIAEVAVDLYAQSDDGAVWYFGEDVFIYRDGRVIDTLGTWRADLDGPASMIMPADPQVGDAYRTENVPGLEFFEESVVTSIGETVMGPTGLIDGAMIGQEFHFPGDVEDKTFAPGYGEFFSGHAGDVEAMALAVPTDALADPPPVELQTLLAGAEDIFDQARAADWRSVSATLRSVRGAWASLRADDIPPRLGAQMRRALGGLVRAVGARERWGASQAALDLATAGLDLRLRYLPPAEIDLARFDVWSRRLILDAAAKDVSAVIGDITTLEWIRDRIPLENADARLIDDQLRYLRAAADAGELKVVVEDTERLLRSLTGLQPAT